jgi:hypothetical protein
MMMGISKLRGAFRASAIFVLTLFLISSSVIIQRADATITPGSDCSVQDAPCGAGSTGTCACIPSPFVVGGELCTCSGGGAPTATPTATCSSNPACTCGAPSNSNVTLSGTSENSTANYNDSCGNPICSYSTFCSWLGGPNYASGANEVISSCNADHGANYYRCGSSGAYGATCGTRTTEDEACACTGGASEPMCSGSPTPAPTSTPSACAAQPTCRPVHYLAPTGGCPACGDQSLGCDTVFGASSADWTCTMTPFGNNCGGCGTCIATMTAQGIADGCSGGGGVSPTPASDPTPTSTPSCFDSGGNGRQCSGAGDVNCLACGNVCAVVGDQPIKTSIGCADGDSSCVMGVTWATNSPSNGVDILLTGPSVSSNLTSYSGPTLMCVDPSHAPPWTFANVNPQALMPAASANTSVITYDPKVMTWNGSYEVCSLGSNDIRRLRSSNPSATAPIVGCSCMTGYEPARVSQAQFGTITYNIHLGAPVLDLLWADVMESLDHHEIAKEKVIKASDLDSEIVPSANATIRYCTEMDLTGRSCVGGGTYLCAFSDCTPYTAGGYLYNVSSCACLAPTPTATPLIAITPTPTPSPTLTATPTAAPTATPNPGTPSNLYTDSGSPWTGSTKLYLSPPQSITPIPTPDPSTSTDVIACVRTCPVDPGNVWIAIRSTSDPTTCTCTTAGYTFDPLNWTCTSCPTNSVIVNGVCQCPQGYSAYGGACMPNPPTSGPIEYTQTAANNNFPTCSQGTGAQNSRMPSTYGLQISSASGTTTPRSSDVTTIITPSVTNTYSYSDPYVNSSGVTYPKYQYADLPHCACMGSGAYTAPLTSGTPSLSASETGGDTLDYISSFSSAGLPNKSYGMVAMALDGKSDGRSGATFAAGASSCACPNVNEYPALNNAGNALSGVECKPVFTDANRILATFNPALDDVSGKSQVYTRSNVSGLPNIISGGYSEPISGGSVVSTVSLPASQGNPIQLGLYSRKIWKCQVGYTLNLSSLTCQWGSATNDHQCDSTSPVASDAKSVNSGVTWSTIVNKKLACCLNDSLPAGSTSGDVKFDCIDNSTQASDFNTLWSSSDNALDGGQINAMILAAANGKALTGFYTLGGARCSEFSEFDPTGIHPGTVNPVAAQQATQQNFVNGSNSTTEFAASSLPVITPPTGALGYAMLQAGFSAAGKKMLAPHPETGNAADIQNAIRCPILVRAAIIASCPAIPNGQNAVHMTATGSASASGATRCPVADHIQVHIRAEQVFTIAGSPSVQTTDTVVDNKDATSISIGNIIRQKNGSNCLPGMVSGTNGCRY